MQTSPQCDNSTTKAKSNIQSFKHSLNEIVAAELQRSCLYVSLALTNAGHIKTKQNAKTLRNEELGHIECQLGNALAE